jgi:N-acyl-D-aspartate/D-glutamate deacylase
VSNFDIIIKNGKIVDGSGNPWIYGDIGISGEKIEKIGGKINEEAKKIIDGNGLIICPGFIDSHTHSDLASITDKTAFNYITQGVSTNVIGNCGWSAAPVNKTTVKDLLSLVAPDLKVDLTQLWESFEDFLNFIDGLKLTINLAPLIGHGTLRIAVMGLDNREPAPDELLKMKEYVEKAMKAGAFGLSAGLEYMPGMFAKPEELIELCRIVAQYNGVFTIHVRNEGDLGNKAIKEAIKIAEESGVSLEISHLKLDGKRNWGKAEERLTLIEQARSRGIEVTTDVYPYTFCMTSLHALLPEWLFEKGLESVLEKLDEEKTKEKLREYYKNGTSMLAPSEDSDWDRVILKNSKKPQFKGKSILHISETIEKPIIDTLKEIIETDGIGGFVVLQGMNEKDVIEIAEHPLTMVGSDGEVKAPENDDIHPRYYGTFPRFLKKMVYEREILSLEEAIRKITCFPALKFHLKKRGLLKEDFFADITVFNPKKLNDNATLEAPNKISEGIKYVIINGDIVYENGNLNRKYPGKILRKNQQ